MTKSLSKLYESFCNPTSIKGLKWRRRAMFLAAWIACILNILALSLLFAYQIHIGFFAISAVLAALIVPVAPLPEKKISYSKISAKHHHKSTKYLKHILNHYMFDWLFGLTFISGALITSASFVCLVLQQRGILQLENLQEFLIFASVPFFIPAVIFFIVNVATAFYQLNNLYNKNKIEVEFIINNDHYILYLLLANICSTAMIAITYLNHGATGMMALPIVASVFMQLIFVSGTVAPHYVAEKATKSISETYSMGIQQVSILGIMLIVESTMVGILASLQYGFNIEIFPLLEFLPFVFAPLMILGAIVATKVIMGCCGIDNAADYAEYCRSGDINEPQLEKKAENVNTTFKDQTISAAEGLGTMLDPTN